MKNPFYRKPDVIIGREGQPYMRRWFVIPRNKWFNIYLHHFLHDDEDRALHDHPWASLSIILRGKYIEHTPGGKIKIFKRGAFIYRKADYTHRIELFKDTECYKGRSGSKHEVVATHYRRVPRPVWTLFITGKKVREWGFHCPKGWRHWKEFVDPNDYGKVGKGCD